MRNLIEAPVLFIVFNRPDTTQKVFDAIKLAKPQKLYIAAEAPRIGNIEDKKNCAIVKEIVKQVDWECAVHYRFADSNQGCGNGVYNAISWAFENEDRLIVLEDDCVPSQPFFGFCNELLERYKYDTRIWVISGNQYYEEAITTPHSYFFSHYGHNWGWATWKRAWTELDMSMTKYPLIIEQDLFKAAFSTNKEAVFFQRNADKIYKNKELKPHTWDSQFGFAITSNGGLSIVPAKNLVSNIGHWGSHTKTKNRFHDRPVDENFKIISHPDFILRDNNYDIYHFEHHYNYKVPLLERIIRKIQKLLKKREHEELI